MGPFFFNFLKIKKKIACFWSKIPKHGSIFGAKSLNMGTFFYSKHGLGSRGPGGTPPSKPKSSTPSPPGRDVRGGSPKWPVAFVFPGGYHPRKTSCKSTVGANRLAGPIMSSGHDLNWQLSRDHYLSVNDSPICIWPKMRTSGAAFFAFLRHNVNAHLLSA